MAYGKTIAAISTPSGKGGVAIIRISGEDAFSVLKRVFVPLGKTQPTDAPRKQIYGNVIFRGECIDDGMATAFPAPNSYTGEDTAEITCHGGILITRKVLSAVLTAGAYPAEAGEFTRRAYINGKITLSEAEGVGNLLEAKTDEQLRLSSAASRSRLSYAIEEIRKRLVDLLSSIFARIDYPDEDLGDFDDKESLTRLYEIRDMIRALLSTYPTGKAINEGVRTVLCGRPNVGKSTLYNAILGEDAAIVTDLEGTTRDVLTASAQLGRVMLSLSDTAGVREGGDAIEKIGIEKTRDKLNSAELILALFDSSREACEEDIMLLSLLDGLSAPKIAILNKCELKERFDRSLLGTRFERVVEISAKENSRDALLKLGGAVEELFTDEKIDTGRDAIVYSARQNAALIRAEDSVLSAIDAFSKGVFTDAAASEVEAALSAIAEADGKAVCDEIVADIFSKFCVGK